jgi:proteasome lid subunit RPN8/RPN11
MMLPLLLSYTHWADLIAQSRYGLPNEICGILGGLDSKVLEIFPVANISSQPSNSFFMDPNGLFRALDILDRRGWALLATYHSHPSGARTDPSYSDRVLASYPGALQVIIVPGTCSTPDSVRAFEVMGDNVLAVPIDLYE